MHTTATTDTDCHEDPIHDQGYKSPHEDKIGTVCDLFVWI